MLDENNKKVRPECKNCGNKGNHHACGYFCGILKRDSTTPKKEDTKAVKHNPNPQPFKKHL